MKHQLFPRMFCSDNPTRDTKFNLRSGQIIGKPSRVSHKGDWYNDAGNWLGCGDLSAENIRQIAFTLEERSVFIVLSNRHHGEFASSRPPGWSKSGMYVARESNLIVVKNDWYFAADHLARSQAFIAQAGLMFKVIDHKRARQIIMAAVCGKLPTPERSHPPSLMTV